MGIWLYKEPQRPGYGFFAWYTPCKNTDHVTFSTTTSSGWIVSHCLIVILILKAVLWSSGKLFILIQISVGLRFNASSSPFDFIYQPTRGSVGEIHVRRAIMSIPPNVAGGYWSCFHPLESDFFPFQLPICPKEVRVVFWTLCLSKIDHGNLLSTVVTLQNVLVASSGNHIENFLRKKDLGYIQTCHSCTKKLAERRVEKLAERDSEPSNVLDSPSKGGNRKGLWEPRGTATRASILERFHRTCFAA